MSPTGQAICLARTHESFETIRGSDCLLNAVETIVHNGVLKILLGGDKALHHSFVAGRYSFVRSSKLDESIRCS